jgi:hypothetical protein
MEFYDSPAAAEMAEAYNRQFNTSIIKVEELLQSADETYNKINATHKILMRRKRVRLEIKLQRIFLTILETLGPEDQELGNQIYRKLQSGVDRLEKLC